MMEHLDLNLYIIQHNYLLMKYRASINPIWNKSMFGGEPNSHMKFLPLYNGE